MYCFKVFSSVTKHVDTWNLTFFYYLLVKRFSQYLNQVFSQVFSRKLLKCDVLIFINFINPGVFSNCKLSLFVSRKAWYLEFSQIQPFSDCKETGSKSYKFIGEIRGETVTFTSDLRPRDQRDRPSNASGWSARVARAPLITPPGCLSRRKSRLYVRKCRVYAMIVGTLMPGYRGCRSHASRWGPHSRAPDPLASAHLSSSSLFLSLNTLFSLPHLSVSHFFLFLFHLSLSLSLFLPLSLFLSSSSSLVDLGHYIYGRWRYSLPNATQTSLRDARPRELMRKTFYVTRFVGDAIPY